MPDQSNIRYAPDRESTLLKQNHDFLTGSGAPNPTSVNKKSVYNVYTMFTT